MNEDLNNSMIREYEKKKSSKNLLQNNLETVTNKKNKEMPKERLYLQKKGKKLLIL